MKKYESVINWIKSGIDLGVLRPGDAIPSIRDISKYMNVSTTTVNEAYWHLENMGYILSIDRKGYKVLERMLNSTDTFSAYNFTKNIELDALKQSHIESVAKKTFIPLGAMAPTNSFFPNDELSLHLSRYARMNFSEINSYCRYAFSENEQWPIAEMTVKYMFRTSNTLISEKELIFTNGASNGLSCVLQTITAPGDIVAVESPGNQGIYRVLDCLKLRPLEIETLPPHGFSIAQFRHFIEEGIIPGCLVIVSNYSDPTGTSLSVEGKKELLQLCQDNDITIIEDDVLGPLHFQHEIPVTLKSLLPEHVIYVSSFAKVLAPGYRIGWIAGGRFTKDIRKSQSVSYFILPHVMHGAVASYLQSGKIGSHLDKLRKIYKKNCDVMIDAVHEYIPLEKEVFRPEGGQYLWITLPKWINANELYYEAHKKGILIAPGEVFTARKAWQNCFRICFALEMNQTVIEAVKTIGRLVSELPRHEA
ncbi:MAG: PLP-dependent aminotransferase family protein [Clostridiales Family XIII bacterium]|jgi:DNA-binding transcriptional MocR family regulator|nr:PLP-dependent aminotransferase family protein [Clostridiales Family XIII bacterium]